MPTMGLLRRMPPVEPWNAASPKAEDAAVGRHQPVAPAVGGGGDADDGTVQVHTCPVEPKNLASPKVKTPPSDATSQ